MPDYVGLVRGINVGNRKIAMADLRALAEQAGFRDVRTVLNTGNVVLSADEGAEGVRNGLERALAQHFGETVPVAVRTPVAMREAAAACPFVPETGEVVYAGFLVEPPAPEAFSTLSERLPETDDAIEVGDQVVYVLYRHGVHTSPLSNNWLERRLKVGVTSRNLNTVRRLAGGDGPGA